MAVVDSVSAVNRPVHAHELAHILTNRGDALVPHHFFFPLSGMPEVVRPNQARRLSIATIERIRASRAAGDPKGEGNRLLLPGGGP